MKEVYANNYISYKEGFMDAKEQLNKSYRLGKSDTLASVEERCQDDIWYAYGYKDSLSNFEQEGSIKDSYIEESAIINLIQNSFSTRISQMNNQEQDNSQFREKYL